MDKAARAAKYHPADGDRSSDHAAERHRPARTQCCQGLTESHPNWAVVELGRKRTSRCIPKSGAPKSLDQKAADSVEMPMPRCSFLGDEPRNKHPTLPRSRG